MGRQIRRRREEPGEFWAGQVSGESVEEKQGKGGNPKKEENFFSTYVSALRFCPKRKNRHLSSIPGSCWGLFTISNNHITLLYGSTVKSVNRFRLSCAVLVSCTWGLICVRRPTVYFSYFSAEPSVFLNPFLGNVAHYRNLAPRLFNDIFFTIFSFTFAPTSSPKYSFCNIIFYISPIHPLISKGF